MKRLMTIILVGCIVLLSGCAMLQRHGIIKTAQGSVFGVADAGKPATLNSATSVGKLSIPAGSKLLVTKWEPVAWQAATPDHPAVVAQPARETTEIVMNKSAEWNKTDTVVQADTGTIDTTIAQHRIDVEANKVLLYASLAAALAAGLFLYIKYPTPALMCGAASIIFFLAWKLSDLPSWFYVVGVGVIAGAVALWRGHERGEAHATAAILGSQPSQNTIVIPPNQPNNG